MSYTIEFSTQATKFIRHQDTTTVQRLFAKLQNVAESPLQYLEHYEGKGHKLRIGVFRAILDLDNVRKTILVRVLDKRGRVYKRNS